MTRFRKINAESHLMLTTSGKTKPSPNVKVWMCEYTKHAWTGACISTPTSRDRRSVEYNRTEIGWNWPSVQHLVDHWMKCDGGETSSSSIKVFITTLYYCRFVFQRHTRQTRQCLHFLKWVSLSQIFLGYFFLFCKW